GGLRSALLVWHPERRGEALGLGGGLLFYVFFRVLFAFDELGKTVRWAYENPYDFVGAWVGSDFVGLADAHGGVLELGFDGRQLHAADTRMTPSAAVFSAAQSRSGDVEPRSPPPLHEQLSQLVQSTDARMVPAAHLALRFLSAMEGPEVTQDLIRC